MGKSRDGWRERWGILPSGISQGYKLCLWVHAVSAGEVVAAVPILRELRVRFPNHYIVLSVITPAGREMAEQQAKSHVDAIFYAPYDLIFTVQRVLSRLKPDAYISMESEMWPNLLSLMKRTGAVNILVNGRMSDKNFGRASTVGKSLFRWMIGNIHHFAVQSELDQGRFEVFGANNISVLGNSKFDQSLEILEELAIADKKRELGLPQNSPILFAGSTRSLEEEKLVLTAYLALKAEFNSLCLILAPRQLDRVDEVVHLIESKGLKPRRRSQQGLDRLPTEVIVLDTMGELAQLYAVATVTFVGNSFPPVVKGGGQNLLQPLANGKPVFVGPLTGTIRSELAVAIAEGVAFQCQDQAELISGISLFLRDPQSLKEISVKALNLMARNRGVSAKYADAVVQAIEANRIK